jgi:hypothetical protein
MLVLRDGLVEFIATPKTMMDFNLQVVSAEVREFCWTVRSRWLFRAV